MPKSKQINFALLGLGKLGKGFYQVYEQKKDRLKIETGFQLNLKKILIKNTHFKRPSNIDPSLITADIDEILNNPEITVVVDAMGGVEPIFGMLKKLIAKKKNIISVNRTLLAAKMHELVDLANKQNVLILPEPSLGGGVPIMSTLQQDLVANKIISMIGILSGTSNFILSEMTQNQISLKKALQSNDIQKMSESLSIIDYEGSDAAQKVAILAAASFGVSVDFLKIHAEGISDISVFDIACAKEFGFEFKLLALMQEHPDSFEIRVHPTLVPIDHPLTLIRGEYNAYFMQTDLMGEYMIYGRGVGVEATSSLILRDLIAVGKLTRSASSHKAAYRISWNNKPILPMSDISSAYYIRFPCVDQPGVMGQITTIMGESSINIASAHAEVRQKIDPDIGYVHILIDNAKESAILQAIKNVEKLNIIKGRVKFFRILRSAQ